MSVNSTSIIISTTITNWAATTLLWSIDSAIRPIRLPNRRQAAGLTAFDGMRASLSGWGALGNTGPAQTQLRWTNMRIISDAECFWYFDRHMIGPFTICSRGYVNGNEGICDRDSGAPLVVNEAGTPTLVGISTFADNRPGCEAHRPNGHMRTSFYLRWISGQTGIAIQEAQTKQYF